MIQVIPQMRILVAVEPADFRKGIDGLAGSAARCFARTPLAATCYGLATASESDQGLDL
jgi:hypothetical protein